MFNSQTYSADVIKIPSFSIKVQYVVSLSSESAILCPESEEDEDTAGKVEFHLKED